LNPAGYCKGHLYGTDEHTRAPLKPRLTGDEKWAQRIWLRRGHIADGKLIALNGTGELSIAPATPSASSPRRARKSRWQMLDGPGVGQWPHLLPQRRGVWWTWT
jgi:hypothetical protein